MPDTGYIVMGTASTGSGGSDAEWISPTDALANDGSYSTAAIDDAIPPLQSHNLAVTNGSFSSIPTGATIDGIEMVVRAQVTPGTADLRGFQVYRNSDMTWYSLTNGGTVNLTGSLTDYTRGGATDLAGTTWTRADIVASGFGANCYTDNASGPETVVSVDSIQVRVYYTTDPLAGMVVNETILPFRAAVQRAATI